MKKRNCPQSLEELISDMENHPDQYQHLKIFLRRELNVDGSYLGKEYLAVSPLGFCLCRINNVEYKDGEIFISLTDTAADEEFIHTVDIHDGQPYTIFIQWKDILNLMSEKSSRNDNN
ncbi:MAG TPA: hypothetical protein PLS58_12080 [Bacteroidales bacterium]|nr:hypothetical protein [Bacteroidales bacterium]